MNQEMIKVDSSFKSLDRKKLDPLNDGISSLELIRVSGGDADIVNAARVSFGKIVHEIGDRDKKLIAFLMEHRHTSPFEHNQLSFRVKAPIFVARHWFRHRMNSFNEVSARYTKSSLEFYVPAQWRYQDKLNKQASVGSFVDESLRAAYKKSLDCSTETYSQLLESGVSRELARGVLPVCTYTEFIFTCNLHSFMNFLKLRMTLDAQYEIRVYAQGMLELALPYFEVSLGEWKRVNNV